MNFTLTLVASNAPLSVGHIEITERFAEENGLMITDDPAWLALHKAVDIPLAECLNMVQIKALRDILDKDKIDVFCTRTKTRKKKLLVADMDATIVTTETLDELAEGANIKDKISAITTRAMRGELDFHTALKERIALLKGLSTDALERTLKNTEISKGAETLIKSMRAQNALCVLVSGGFTYFTNAIAGRLGFDAHHGNRLDIDGNQLSGTVSPPILDKDSKLGFLKNYCEKQKIPLSDSVAIGDGANDLPMLEGAGLGLGYQPKPLLEESLLNNIYHTDLTSALYVQGYKEEQILS